MPGVKIVENRCPQNHPCPIVIACPKGAVVQKSPYSVPTIDKSKCTNCGACTFYCAFGVFEINMN